MTAERVNKKWIEMGMDQYSNEAILGTLGHYGVTLTTEQFVELAKNHYPLAMAEQWHTNWKGTGQFSKFPAAAAEQLWSRLMNGALAPTDLALAMINLLQTMSDLLDKKPDDRTSDTRFKVVEAYVAKVPAEGEQRDRFMAETLAALGEWSEIFDGMAEALSKSGLTEHAERMVAIDESLFPENVGIGRALIRAAKGEVDEAATALKAIALDTARQPIPRFSAAAGLIDLQHPDDAVETLLVLIAVAEEKRDIELVSAIVQALQRIIEADPQRKDRAAIRDRIATTIDIFDAP